MSLACSSSRWRVGGLNLGPVDQGAIPKEVEIIREIRGEFSKQSITSKYKFLKFLKFKRIAFQISIFA